MNEISSFIEKKFNDFFVQQLQELKSLTLPKLLHNENPYLLSGRNIFSVQDLIVSILDSRLFLQEELFFNSVSKELAIFINSKVYGGKKSSAEGIDLEFERDGILYIVAIKSGPNWGNSSQIKRMVDNFKKAQRILRTSNTHVNIRAVNGCCYGQENQPDKGEYLKLCGQDFWEFISSNDQLYLEIIEPLGYRSRERNDQFSDEYGRILNIFTNQFYEEFCQDGTIVWDKLVKFNSGRK